MDKKTSFWNRAKDTLACCFVFNPNERGKKVWNKLNQDLPEPTGWWVNDEPRVEAFVKKAEKLSFLDSYALKEWLAYAYRDMDNSWPEMTSGRIEEHITKWCQIYRQHLEAITGKKLLD